MAEPIDVFGGLKTYSTKSGSAKAYLEIKAPDITIEADEKGLAGNVAALLEQRIKARLFAGLAPDGGTLPPLSAASHERRRWRAKQAARGGQAAERYKDPRFRAKVASNYRKNYTAPKLGSFTPGKYDSYGLDSGMLAASVKAAFRNGTWAIYFAAARAGRHGHASPVERVLGGRAWSSQAFDDPEIQEALRKLLLDQLKSRARNALNALLETSASTLETVNEQGPDEG